MLNFSRSFHLAVAAGIVLLAAAGFAVWYAARPAPPPTDPPDNLPTPDPPTPDPRLVFNTPFRNVKPGVGYVGDAVCAGCHEAVATSYHSHPMGRSAAFVDRATSIEKYDPAVAFSSGPFDLRVETTAGGRVRHHVRLRGPTPAPVPEFTIPAEIAIGSGTRGRSYLTVEGGAVWQTPVSWFGPDEKWDLSPGFRLGVAARRPIVPECLYCHVDRVEPIPGATNRYREPLITGQAAIGCERCHGPGELHAAERAGGRVGGLDTSIVNPRHLSPALQAAVCEQCHLQGEERVARRGRDVYEFRPGLPFEQFASVFVRHPDIALANRSVGQFEQMEQSRCFTAGGGRMVCTSCHDPHQSPAPADRDAFYRQKCMTCHESRGCSLPPPDRQAKADSCVACHMPRSASSNIVHASVTDHRVPRTPAARPASRGLPFGTPPLVRFRDGPLSPPPEERERDFGIALARFSLSPLASGLADPADIRAAAAERLKGSLARWPGDAPAWGALASVRTGRAESAEKLKAAATAAALAPESDAALTGLVEAATAAGEYDTALEAAGRLIRRDPRSTDPLLRRAFVHLAREDWVSLGADARAVLAVNPLHPEGRMCLAIAQYHQGDRAAAQREAETAVRAESDPRGQQNLRDWYRRATR